MVFIKQYGKRYIALVSRKPYRPPDWIFMLVMFSLQNTILSSHASGSHKFDWNSMCLISSSNNKHEEQQSQNWVFVPASLSFPTSRTHNTYTLISGLRRNVDAMGSVTDINELLQVRDASLILHKASLTHESWRTVLTSAVFLRQEADKELKRMETTGGEPTNYNRVGTLALKINVITIFTSIYADMVSWYLNCCLFFPCKGQIHSVFVGRH